MKGAPLKNQNIESVCGVVPRHNGQFPVNCTSAGEDRRQTCERARFMGPQFVGSSTGLQAFVG